MSVEKEIEKLAEHVAKEAMAAATPLPDKIDALKAVTAYYAAFKKANKGHETDDEPSLADLLAQSIQDQQHTETANGGTPIRSGRGRRNPGSAN